MEWIILFEEGNVGRVVFCGGNGCGGTVFFEMFGMVISVRGNGYGGLWNSVDLFTREEHDNNNKYNNGIN